MIDQPDAVQESCGIIHRGPFNNNNNDTQYISTTGEGERQANNTSISNDREFAFSKTPGSVCTCIDSIIIDICTNEIRGPFNKKKRKQKEKEPHESRD